MMLDTLEREGYALVEALLAEVAALLGAFVNDGREGVIDLSALPLPPGELARLDAALGEGEVAALASVGGDSEVWETAYAGVWRVRHRGDGGRILADTIEIAAVPRFLRSHPEDAKAALRRLEAHRALLTTSERRGEI